MGKTRARNSPPTRLHGLGPEACKSTHGATACLFSTQPLVPGEIPVGRQGPPEQREVAGIFLAARSPQCPTLGCGGMRRNRNTVVGQPGTAPHTALQRALLGKTDPLPDRKPQGL